MKAAPVWICVALLLVAPAVLAGEGGRTVSGSPEGSWLASAERLAAESGVRGDAGNAPPPPAGDGPPLPLHTIEGVGGALTVPMAYLVNPGPEGTVIGKPSASVTFLSLGTKNLTTFAVTETLFRRIELGYAVGRFDIGNLGHVAKKATGGAVAINRRDIWLHHFNARVMVVPENTEVFGIPMPGIVAGIQAKYNADIQDINDGTRPVFPAGGFNAIGLSKSNGIDYVVTASKMFPTLLFGRPLILTFGVRNSKASNFGYTGFGDKCHTTVEYDVATLVTDNLAIGYEFRQRTDPYDKLRPLHKGETNLHAIRAAWLINSQLVLAGGWACMGNVANDRVDCAWGVQLKYEF
jgi:hypothetical protein